MDPRRAESPPSLRSALAHAPEERRPLLTPGDDVPPEQRRVWVLLSVGTLSAIAAHVVYTAFFAAIGARAMLAINAVSIPAYVAAFLLARRGWFLASVVVCTLELCAHQTLGVLSFGWEAGLAYYLLVLPAVAASIPGARAWVRVALGAAPCAVFLALRELARGAPPLHPLSPWLLAVLHSSCVVGVFLLLGLFAHYFARASEAAERSVREQHDRAEALLHAILPVPIADRLKRSRGIIADGFPTASVLFADLVGFTVMSSELPPERIVAMLDDLFSDFDALVDARGLEKIKTIGDAYMVAAGVPAPRDAHAEALAELALEMRAAVERRHRATGLPLRMRIGIHSGPVVAGVIGRRKFVYDLWGDTVNTAARMESHGVPGEIQLSRATRDLLGEGFELEARGEIPIKGKGSMEVFLLRGRRDAPAAS